MARFARRECMAALPGACLKYAAFLELPREGGISSAGTARLVRDAFQVAATVEGH